jgi:hypothetical protein
MPLIAFPAEMQVASTLTDATDAAAFDRVTALIADQRPHTARDLGFRGSRPARDTRRVTKSSGLASSDSSLEYVGLT